YLALRSLSSGPIVPDSSPPLIWWQERQLPLPRSKAIFWPSPAADCACTEVTDSASANARASTDGMGWRIKSVSVSTLRSAIARQKHKGNLLAIRTIDARK